VKDDESVDDSHRIHSVGSCQGTVDDDQGDQKDARPKHCVVIAAEFALEEGLHKAITLVRPGDEELFLLVNAGLSERQQVRWNVGNIFFRRLSIEFEFRHRGGKGGLIGLQGLSSFRLGVAAVKQDLLWVGGAHSTVHLHG